MKFLATATLVLLASLADTASAGSVQRKLDDHWDGKSKEYVNDAGIYVNRMGDFVMKRRACQGKCTVLLPRIPKEKGHALRKLRALEINERRRNLAATGPKAENAPEDGATIVGEIEEFFEFSGLAEASSAMLIFTQGGKESVSYDLLDLENMEEDVEDGVFSVEISPGPGTWKWGVKFTSNGEDGVLEGGTVTFTPAAVTTDPSSKTANTAARKRPGESGIVTQLSGVGSAPEGGDVGEAPWEGGGRVQEAVGRIYFSSFGVDYACSGTAVKDNKSGRSLIFTAAHCVWDDIDGNFGANAIFIPNRDAVQDSLVGNETGADIHRQCADDICGCWSLSGGVVHDLWADTPWPNRLDYDYGFWVVDDVGSHEGEVCGSDALDQAVDVLEFSVGDDMEGAYVYNFGYSLAYNPDFRYCTEEVGLQSPTDGVWTGWMDGCGLTGGASGGPWIADFDEATGIGKVVSVNSWSYSDSTGMGGPFIEASAARCLVNEARNVDIAGLEALDDGEGGIFVECHDRPCIEDETSVRKLRGNRKLCETTDSKP